MESPLHLLYQRRKIWKSKKIVQKLYRTWYHTIKEHLKPGVILEIGGGSGNLKEFLPDAISSDVFPVPWLDSVLDAHDLPFKNESLDNIILFDVLHHLIKPVRFFSEAHRTLKKNGRILLMEPYVSWASFLIYKFLHSEGLNWNVDPFWVGCSQEDKHPLQGNQAIPTLMFEKHIHRFAENFPQLKILKQQRTDFLAYPLSGGFHNPSLCPHFLYSTLTHLERFLQPLNRFMAFRLFVVLEKRR